MKKILMIMPYSPFPSNDGAKIRMMNSLLILSEKNQVTVVYNTEENILAYNKNIKKVFESKIISGTSSIWKTFFRFFVLKKTHHVSKFYNKKMEKIIADILENESFDYIYIHFYCTLSMIGQKKLSENIVIIDEHNNDEEYYDSFRKSGNFFQKIIADINIKRIIKEKEYYSKSIDYILSVSEENMQESVRFYKEAVKCLKVPNGVDTDFFKEDKKIKKEKALIICGSMDVTMNYEAVDYFFTSIFPKLMKYDKSIKIYIVGRNPHQKILKYAKLYNCIITGTVDDVRGYYNKALISLSPYKFGGGTKLKNLESMAMGIPIVSTSIGCQGIGAENNHNIIIADNEFEFVTGIINLLEDTILYDKIRKNAYSHIKMNYTWDKIFTNLIAEISQDLTS